MSFGIDACGYMCGSEYLETLKIVGAGKASRNTERDAELYGAQVVSTDGDQQRIR